MFPSEVHNIRTLHFKEDNGVLQRLPKAARCCEMSEVSFQRFLIRENNSLAKVDVCTKDLHQVDLGVDL